MWAGRRGEQRWHSCLWISSLLMSLVWHGSTEAVSTLRLQTTSLSNPQSGHTHSPRGQRTCLVHSPSWFIPFLTYPYRPRCNPWQHAGLMLTEFWFRGRKKQKNTPCAAASSKYDRATAVSVSSTAKQICCCEDVQKHYDCKRFPRQQLRSGRCAVCRLQLSSFLRKNEKLTNADKREIFNEFLIIDRCVTLWQIPAFLEACVWQEPF